MFLPILYTWYVYAVMMNMIEEIKTANKAPFNYLFELKWKKKKDNYETIKNDGVKQIKSYLELDSIKNIPDLKSFLFIGSHEGVEV